jgi:hypothetical protein
MASFPKYIGRIDSENILPNSCLILKIVREDNLAIYSRPPFSGSYNISVFHDRDGVLRSSSDIGNLFGFSRFTEVGENYFDTDNEWNLSGYSLIDYKLIKVKSKSKVDYIHEGLNWRSCISMKSDFIIPKKSVILIGTIRECYNKYCELHKLNFSHKYIIINLDV